MDLASQIFRFRPAKRIPSPESLPLRHETKQPGGTMGKKGQNEGKKTAPNVESTWKIPLKPEIYEYIYNIYPLVNVYITMGNHHF